MNPQYRTASSINASPISYLAHSDDAVATCNKAQALDNSLLRRTVLIAAYAQKADTEKAAAAKLLKQRPDLSIALLKGMQASDNPVYVQRREATLYAGLRKAGIPEQYSRASNSTQMSAFGGGLNRSTTKCKESMRIPSTQELVDPSFYRKVLRKIGSGIRRPVRTASDPYEDRLQTEQRAYTGCVDVHNLPQIFHYWSNAYIRPKIIPFGFDHPDKFFALYLERAAERCSQDPPRFVSIGAGNCDTEVRVAKLLRERGLDAFTIECIDINAAMLRRGRELAEQEGVSAFIISTLADFNKWNPDGEYCAILANQSLHHVLGLEHLFASIAGALLTGGLFIAFDVIGRNGHQRWPEALEIVQEYWNELPHSYRFNQQLRRFEETFLDWDCSTEGFEGIRAQDILPLLVERFEFDLFIPFANIIDPFVDRSFGHNFNHTGEWDRAFIDRVHARDEYELRRGAIKPTHMFAVMCQGRKGESRFCDGTTPAGSIRVP